MANTNAANAIMLERVKKEFSAEYNVKPRDPFATTLASLVGGLSDEGRAPAPAAPKAGSKLSRASGAASRVDRSSQMSGSKTGGADRRSRLSGAGASQLSASQQRQPSAAAEDDMRSEITSVTTASWRTPSSIRSSEPSAVARNKIAELQLRVELERVLRLQKETELEQQRREHLLTASKSGGAGAK